MTRLKRSADALDKGDPVFEWSPFGRLLQEKLTIQQLIYEWVSLEET